jgi:hypothetical protein
MALTAPRALFLFSSFPFYTTLPSLLRMIRERRIGIAAMFQHQAGEDFQPGASSTPNTQPSSHPATVCYWCKIIFHFQTWGIGFNLCPVLCLAKWKLVLVMQINAELQKADKRAHTQNHIHRHTLISNTQHQRLQPCRPAVSSLATGNVLFWCSQYHFNSLSTIYKQQA